MRGHMDTRASKRRHGQYVWRDPESDDHMRVDVFGSEEFFQDLLALGFLPSGGSSTGSDGARVREDSDDEPEPCDDPLPGQQGADRGVEASIRRLRPADRAQCPRGTSEGRAEVRRKGA